MNDRTVSPQYPVGRGRRTQPLSQAPSVTVVAVTAVITVATWIFASATASADEARCNDRIGKEVAKLHSTRVTRFSQCIRHDNYDACPTTDRKIENRENKVRSAIAGANSRCVEAVDVQGVPIGNFGPATCPPAWNRCDEKIPAIATLDDLAECFICQQAGLDARYRFEVDLPQIVPAAKNDEKCIRRAVVTLAKAARSGVKDVTRCAKHQVAPINCPLDDDPQTKFGRSLAKIVRKLDRCRDGTGVVGAIGDDLQVLCHRTIKEPSDLATCFSELATCMACRISNAMYGQSQDCDALSGALRCTGAFAETGSFVVANEADDSVTLYDAAGNLPGSLAASSTDVGSAPNAVAVNAATSRVYVVNGNDDTVTYLNADDGSYAFGTLAASTFAVGAAPVALAVHENLGIVYVVNRDDGTVTLLDAADGSYVFGTLGGSTFPTGTSPAAAAVNMVDDIVYVVNTDDDTVAFLDATSGLPLNGTLPASSFATGNGPAGVAWSSVENRILVTNSLDGTAIVLDGQTGAPAFVDAAGSTFAAGTDPGPVLYGDGFFYFLSRGDDRLFALAEEGGVRTVPTQAGVSGLTYDRFRDLLRVTESGNDSVSLITIGDAKDNSTVDVDRDATAVGLDGTRGLIYVATGTFIAGNFPGKITYLDAATGDYVNGTLVDSRVEVGRYAAGIAVNPAAGLVYVSNSVISPDAFYVTFLDASEPNYANGTWEDSSFDVGGWAYAVAVDPVANLLYVARRDGPNAATAPQAITILDATTGAYLNGTLEGSSFTVGSSFDSVSDIHTGLAVNPAANRLYVTNSADDTVTYLNATTGAYAAGTLGASTFGVGAEPRALAVHPGAGLLYVANSADGTVTFLDATTGAYANGTLGASTFAVGLAPRSATVDTASDVLYVSNSGDHTVTYLDALTGAYLHGTFEASTFRTAREPHGMVFDPAQNALVVAGVDTGEVTYLDATTGDHVFPDRGLSSLDASSFEVGIGPTGVAVSTAHDTVFVANQEDDTVTLLDASDGSYVGGTLAGSTVVTGNAPHGIAVNDASDRAYVGHAGEGNVVYLEASSGAYVNGTLATSSVSVGTDSRAIAVDTGLDIVYVTSLSDDMLVYLDGTTNAYLNGTLAASNISNRNIISGVAVNSTTGKVFAHYRLFSTNSALLRADAASNTALGFTTIGSFSSPYSVATSESLGATYASSRSEGIVAVDADTGAYLNGNLAASTFGPLRVAALVMNDPAGILYASRETNRQGVVYMDASAQDFLYGSEQSSRFAVRNAFGINAMAVNTSSNLLYVANENDDSVTYLDATTGEHLNPGSASTVSAVTGASPSAVAFVLPRQ